MSDYTGLHRQKNRDLQVLKQKNVCIVLYHQVPKGDHYSSLQFFVILLLLVLTEVTLVVVIHIFHDKVSSPPVLHVQMFAVS